MTEIMHAGIAAPAETPKREPKRIRVPTLERIADAVAESGPDSSPSYIERMAQQRRDWKEQDRKKFYNPEHALPAKQDPDDKVWNVYVWNDEGSRTSGPHWVKVGERTKKTNRRKPMTQNRLFAIVRQQFGIPRESCVLLVSQRDDRGDHPAPKHRDTLRPHKPPTEALAVRETPKTKKTKIRKDRGTQVQLDKHERRDGSVFFTFKTRYVAWAKQPRGTKFFYLGPCESGTKVSAKAEIRKRYPIYPDPVVLEVRRLSYSLRSRIRSGKLIAGVTKMKLPEVK